MKVSKIICDHCGAEHAEKVHQTISVPLTTVPDIGRVMNRDYCNEDCLRNALVDRQAQRRSAETACPL
jgi:hypothetical protein